MAAALLLGIALLFLLLADDDASTARLAADDAPEEIEESISLRTGGVAPVKLPEKEASTGRSRKAWRALLPAYARWINREGTPFQIRLRLGTLCSRVASELAEDKVTAEEARAVLETYHPFLLSFEAGKDPLGTLLRTRPEIPKKSLGLLLAEIAKPALHRKGVKLHGSRLPTTPYGKNLTVRVWTGREDTFPREPIEESEALLRRLDDIVAPKIREGFDVVATPKFGWEVLGDLGLRFPFKPIGVYFQRDKLCVFGTKHLPRNFQRLLNHELIHAWAHRGLPGWRKRFVSEGMARYLSFVLAHDTSLDVPEARLQNHLAYMLEMVDRLAALGANMRDFPLAALVRAHPWAFYELGSFAYAVAMACFAYLPEGVLDKALRTKNEGVLLTAFQAIKWKELLAWARVAARGGKASEAWIPSDVELGGEKKYSDSRALALSNKLARELFGKGLSHDDFLKAIWGSTGGDGDLDSPTRLRQAFAALERAGPEGVDMIYESTAVLEEAVELERALAIPQVAGARMPDSPTAQDAVQLLWHWLAKDGEKRPARLAAVGNRVALTTKVAPTKGHGLNPAALRGYLSYLPRGGHLVVCVGARDPSGVHRKKALAETPKFEHLKPSEQRAQVLMLATVEYLYRLESQGVEFRTVLVVDLGQGAGEARALAEAFVDVAPHRGIVAYLPLREPVEVAGIK